MRLTTLALMFLLLPALAEARVVRIEASEAKATFQQRSFGQVGTYDRIMGRYHGELDPTDPQLATIKDIQLATRNARGMIEYSADFFILRPSDPAKANGTLFYDFANRGNKGILFQYNGARSVNLPALPEHAGDGFLMNHGFTLVWSGYLGDVEATPDPYRVTIQLPVAKNADGSVIEQTVQEECFNDFWTNGRDEEFCRLTYPVPRLDQKETKLYARERRSDPLLEIPSSEWEFADARSIRLRGGKLFRNGLIYQVVHRAQNPPVMGIGLAAVNDWISFLRNRATDDFGNPNPLAGQVRTVLSFGLSQSGRVSRELLYQGFNEDRASPGRKIFDGMTILGAATRPFLNFRFALPTSSADGMHEGLYFPNSEFPFAFQDETDPRTGRVDGILHRCARSHSCPKIMNTAGTPDYWQLRTSLVTTKPDGSADGVLPENVRVYFLPGLGHSMVPANYYGACQHPGLSLNFGPVLRKGLLHMRAWVESGTAPPASRYPKISDGTLVPGPQYAWPRVAGSPHPGNLLNPLRLYEDLTQFPPREIFSPFQVLVPQVDTGGNELAGVFLPAVSEPLASYAGWARRARKFAIGEVCGIMGSEVRFARDIPSRESAGDERPSIAERYSSRAQYDVRVGEAADRLLRELLILPEDREAVVREALGKW